MEKIKVLLVDDEYLERSLIRLGTNWVEHGFEIIGEADSGEAALEIIKQNKPDIVFTDICMPFMDGLEFTKIIREQYEDIKVIIITGHREFEYAKTAVSLGVTEFLLKPINHENVLSMSMKIKGEIEKQRRFFDEFNAMKRIISENNSILGSKSVNKRCSEIVEKAKKNIDENLPDIELSLSTVAGRLFVSPSYLSRVFKQDMEENITDYIMKLRMRKAIEYIKNTNYKAYEIADKIGISDPHYFSICFKKFTGKSINEYKKSSN
jgi:YesN/AraC family two-component response regulator